MVQRILLAIAFLATIAAFPAPAHAQCAGNGIPPGLNKGPCVYSVKFVCGLQQPIPNLPPPLEPPVKPGNYATAVNIHNFHNNQDVPIAKKAVIANTEDQPPGPIGQFRKLVLVPDQALEIDCPDIVRLLQNPGFQPPQFIKGFVEVISPVPLSVTGVYTAQGCEVTPVANVCSPTGPVSIEVVPQQAFAGP